MVNPIPPPSENTIDLLFPLTRNPPPANLFEIGLVLGGTVSAAAYTAGALDCLLEMLEGFYAYANRKHDIAITMVAGASGGALCSGMLGLLTRKIVPHPTGNYADLVANHSPTGNPLWDIWVNSVDGTGFLGKSDIGSAPLISLLNGALLDSIATQVVNIASVIGNDQRLYFPSPYRMAVTLTNLQGIPYTLEVPHFASWSGAAYTAHDDFVRFAIANGADPAAPPEPDKGWVGKRPDEFWVDPALRNNGNDYVGFQTLIDYAVASAAFPAGLPARVLSRPAQHFAYRAFLGIDENGKTVVNAPQPDWDGIAGDGDDTLFTSVDGGVFNNDPVQLVHQALAGMAGYNPRSAQNANRALLMIDPLAAKPRQTDTAATPTVPAADLISILGILVSAITDGARYLTADMALIGNPNIFSRFQLVPSRPDLQKVGEAALATDCMQAFGGFFCRDFRVHDFLLGRTNMRDYLRTTMVLRGDNALFVAYVGTDEYRTRWAVDAKGNHAAIAAGAAESSYFLPIIPDTTYDGHAALPVLPNTTTLPWPYGKLDPTSLRPVISGRVEAVIGKLRQQELPGFLSWIVGGLIEGPLTSALTDEVIKLFQESLFQQGLGPKPPG
jgi:hypothetical protein